MNLAEARAIVTEAQVKVPPAAATRKARSKLERIAAKHTAKHGTRPDTRPRNPTPRVPYAVGSGALELFRAGGEWVSQGMFQRLVVAGLKIGSDFAWPEGVPKADRADWDRGYKAQRKVHDKIKAEARKALQPFVDKHGGFMLEVHGSRHSVIGWAVSG